MNAIKRNRFLAILALAMVVMIGGFTGLATFGSPATAGPEIIGDPNGSELRAIVQDADSVDRIIYIAPGVKTMADTTPVASDPDCSNAGTLHGAEVVLVGTMTGTNPTLAIKWQNSFDGGVTWNDVGTWTTINATTTPANQKQFVADQFGTTAVAYGDCWRSTYVFGGTGTVTANFQMTGIEK